MPHARLGLVVPKRGTPHAVDRNRTKRLVREAFRHRTSTLPAYDLVVQVFRSTSAAHLRAALAASFSDLEKISTGPGLAADKHPDENRDRDGQG